MDKRTAIGLAYTVLNREIMEAIYLKTGYNFTKPNHILISLTDRCNYKCGYCNHWHREQYVDELSLEKWIEIVNELQSYLGRFSIQFLGGEPLISPAFLPLVEHCHHIGVRWGFITNGALLTGTRIERLVAAAPMNIDISIDSNRSSCHDEARGVTGSLDRLSANLEKLKQARADSGQSFPIRLKPTVHRLNFDHLQEIVEWASSLTGVLVDFSPVRLPKGEERDRFYVTGSAPLARLQEEIEGLIAMKSAGAPIETSAKKLRAIIAHFSGEDVKQGNDICRTGLRMLDIRPNGVVNHCWRFHDIGNVAVESSKSIWLRSQDELTAKTIACQHVFTGRCGTACTAHRRLADDVRRGLKYISRIS